MPPRYAPGAWDGLDGFARTIGLLDWNSQRDRRRYMEPEQDAWLAAPYSFETRAKRGLNKAALQKLFG